MMGHLETVDVEAGLDIDNFRLPVQMVIRPDLDFRGFAGTIASGVVRPGDRVTSLPSGVSSTVDEIVTMDGALEVAGPGRAVTLTLADEIDVSRGDILVGEGVEPLRAHDVDAMLVWMSEAPLVPGREYVLQNGNGTSNAAVRTIHHRVDINTLDHESASELALNDIAWVQISSDRELLFDRYDDNRQTGAFILIDRLSNATVGAGMITGAGSAWDRTPRTVSSDKHRTCQVLSERSVSGSSLAPCPLPASPPPASRRLRWPGARTVRSGQGGGPPRWRKPAAWDQP